MLVLSKLHRFRFGVILVALLLAHHGFATDPPHTDGDNYCSNCHLIHQALGDSLLNTSGGNATLCQSCHLPGGVASAKPFSDSDQAVPGPGLPAGTVPRGTSHRWDSGAGGRVVFLGGAATPSSGTVVSGGAFTGPYAKTYTLTISASGGVGVARFNWTATTPGGGSGSGLLTGTNVALNEGILVTFAGDSNALYQVNDKWQVFVRTDLRAPTNAALLANVLNGQMSCSTCHDVHKQTATPFDPAAPAYNGSLTGAGRHYQAMDNDADQMCLDCHAARNVTNYLAGSHPVGIPVTANSYFKNPSVLPLDKTGRRVMCSTCHDVHYAASTDGNLLRMTNQVSLCADCHQLANVITPAAHFNTASGVLWPGGQYGSTFPQITNLAMRGSCDNCHQAHGWPVATNTAAVYDKLLVDQEENLCFTCHDANGPASKNVMTDFSKTYHHLVVDAQQRANRAVECNSCHNPHKALSGSHTYSITATAARNQVSNPLKGVDGVAFNYTGLTNFQTVTTNRFTAIPKSTGAAYEYQICFKCHSTYAWGTGTPPNGLSPNGTATTPAETDCAQEFSPMNKSGHPIVTGLDNYPNSIAVGSPARKGLQAAALLAPWNVNVGQQTMMCSDCHNTDAATPAAQGPHGSAAQFMLRGANAANWPNVTLANFSTSWCANCHVKNAAGAGHTTSDHSSRRCYECHIVIPHGGKMSRLIGDRDTMPSRYAYNNTLSTMQMRTFTKASTYSSGNCGAACRHTGGTENW
jgi:predicted CXXCH cytochrome family protein